MQTLIRIMVCKGMQSSSTIGQSIYFSSIQFQACTAVVGVDSCRPTLFLPPLTPVFVSQALFTHLHQSRLSSSSPTPIPSPRTMCGVPFPPSQHRVQFVPYLPCLIDRGRTPHVKGTHHDLYPRSIVSHRHPIPSRLYRFFCLHHTKSNHIPN